MVWETSQSSLYRAVEDYNRNIQPIAENNSQPSCCETANAAQNDCRSTQTEEQPRCKCNQSERSECSNCLKCSPPAANPIQSLLNDRDTLLIAALIIILIHEKADMKIVLALAAVLLL